MYVYMYIMGFIYNTCIYYFFIYFEDEIEIKIRKQDVDFESTKLRIKNSSGNRNYVFLTLESFQEAEIFQRAI